MPIFLKVLRNVVIAEGLLLPFLTISGHFEKDVHSISALIGILGALYSVLVAFVTFVVWSQFNETEGALLKEVSSLHDLLRFSSYFPDSASDIKRTIGQYANLIVSEEIKCLANKKDCPRTEDVFIKLTVATRNIKAQRDEEKVFLTKLVDVIEEASTHRDERLAKAKTKIPKTLWHLLWTLSASIMAVFYLMPFYSKSVAFVTAACLSASLTFILEVIRDMDNPFSGYWNISTEPLEELSEATKFNKGH